MYTNLTNHIIMVRHGQAQNNVERRLAGRMEGVMLTPEGVRQSEYAAAMLRPARVSAIYASPVERADRTARIISAGCGGVPVVTDERLTEIDMGKFTGMTFDEVRVEHSDIFAKFYEGDVEIAHKGVETFEQVRRRVTDVVSEVSGLGGNVVLVTHMDPIKAVLGEVTGMPPERLSRVEIENAALNVFARVRAGGGRLSLRALNLMDTARLAW